MFPKNINGHASNGDRQTVLSMFPKNINCHAYVDNEQLFFQWLSLSYLCRTEKNVYYCTKPWLSTEFLFISVLLYFFVIIYLSPSKHMNTAFLSLKILHFIRKFKKISNIGSTLLIVSLFENVEKTGALVSNLAEEQLSFTGYHISHSIGMSRFYCINLGAKHTVQKSQ